MKSKKALMSLSTTILVVATLILVVSALFLFVMKGKGISERFDVSGINEVYVQRQILDFEIKQIADNIVYEENPDEQFKAELERWLLVDSKKPANPDSSANPDLINLEKQINSNNVYFDNQNNLVVDLDITLVRITYSLDKKVKLYTTTYSYKFNYIRAGVV